MEKINKSVGTTTNTVELVNPLKSPKAAVSEE